jgi:hypothetical protein
MTTSQKISKENYLILKIVSSLILIYLILAPFGYLKKFDIADILLIIVILLFNSEVIERLINLVITKDGITINLQEFKQEQDKQRNNIESNKNSIEAITEIIQRLTMVEQELANSETTTNFVVSSLLNNYEWEHLLALSSEKPFNYRKRYSFEQELRHLRTLGFIENKLGVQIRNLPESGDLKQFFTVTEQGKEYLLKRKTLQAGDSDAKVVNR